MHELSEFTKRNIDVGSAAFVAAAARTRALMLADWALIVTIIATLPNALWTAMRIHDGIRTSAG